jgi:hypothetical protein
MRPEEYTRTSTLREDARDGEVALNDFEAEPEELMLEVLEERMAPGWWKCSSKKTAGWGC